MPARKTDLRPDAKGRYRPYLGWKAGDDGVRRQHRFNLGTDRKEAEGLRRNEAIKNRGLNKLEGELRDMCLEPLGIEKVLRTPPSEP